MYQAYTNFADFSMALEDEWAFENALFDFNKTIGTDSTIEQMYYKILHTSVDYSPSAQIAVGANDSQGLYSNYLVFTPLTMETGADEMAIVEFIKPAMTPVIQDDFTRNTATVGYSENDVRFAAEPIVNFNLSSLNGSNGFVIYGDVNAGNRLGISISAAGDINGDGIDDFMIGARGPAVGGYSSGRIYVLFGRLSGFDSAIDISTLSRSDGFEILGASQTDYNSRYISGFGDVNGDGNDDILLSAHGDDVFVLYGRNSTEHLFPQQINLSNLPISDGVSYTGVSPYLRSDLSGDINGDGYEDMLIVSSDSGYEIFIIFGSVDGFQAEIDRASFVQGIDGYSINDRGPSRFMPTSVSYAGDVNGDGRDDIIIGDDGQTFGTAKSYVIFGTDNGYGDLTDLDNLDGSDGFVIQNTPIFRSDLGAAVSRAGDFNGDGIDDFMVSDIIGGAFGSGEVYVVFGSTSGRDGFLNVSELDGTNGVIISSSAEQSINLGAVISAAGDINGDGYDDILVGTDITSGGQNYVIFGGNNFQSNTIDVTQLNGFNGFVIPTTARQGFSPRPISSAGDVNGDGLDDIIIGDPLATINH